MKFVVILIVAVVALAAVCEQGDAAITYPLPEQRIGYPPQGDCLCENCQCKSRFACAQENMVNRYCPGSYIYVCCKINPTV